MGMKDVHLKCDTCGKLHMDQTNEEFKRGDKIKYPDSPCGHENYTVVKYAHTLASETPFGHFAGIESGLKTVLEKMWERGNAK